MSAATIVLIAAKLYPSSIVKKINSQPPQVLAEQKKVEKQKIAEAVAAKKSSPPSAISIPSQNLKLAVAPGVILNNEWTLYDDKVSWLSTSETPGDGNVIIYGHSREHLFGNLDALKIGQEIKVESPDKTYTYIVVQKRKVLPEEVDVIISDKNQLTLYTCDGSFDQKRLVVFANPKS